MASQKFEITYVVCIIFLLDSTGPVKRTYFSMSHCFLLIKIPDFMKLLVNL